MEGYMTTRQAAEMLGIKITSVSRLIRSKAIEAEKFGMVWMIRRESIVSYLERTAGESKFSPNRKRARQ